MRSPKVHIALPVLNESENLPALLNCLKNQTVQDFSLTVCVNQYESWWDDPSKKEHCLDNQKSLVFLRTCKDLSIEVIDHSSRGKGWPPKKGGVGHARKTAMDRIARRAKARDLILSMDADTFYPPDYLASVKAVFQHHPEITGLAVPYYHRLTGETTDRLILRYETFMRYYLLNMLRIENPYAFTALGSAMAFPVRVYKKLGGLTPVQSGEDFYFLQKLAKNGRFALWAGSTAFPSSRLSDRVLFGTGPALIKGSSGDWASYPFYPYTLFDKLQASFACFPGLFREDLPTPMDAFLRKQFNTRNVWEPLRRNYNDLKNFTRACAARVDGLRILQYLRSEQDGKPLEGEKVLTEFLRKFHREALEEAFPQGPDFSFDASPVSLLNRLRNLLLKEEMRMREKHDQAL